MLIENAMASTAVNPKPGRFVRWGGSPSVLNHAKPQKNGPPGRSSERANGRNVVGFDYEWATYRRATR